MITNIKLKNFKCYADQDFKLNKLTIFCGNNSVGKSTAIQALAIPFQSKLNDEVYINDDLVELGTNKDIYCQYAVNEPNKDELKIILGFDGVNHAWGTSEFDVSSNKLRKLEGDSSILDEIKTHYYTQKGFQFLEAERFGPRNYFENNYDLSIKNWLGSKGQYIFQVLTHLDEKGAKLEINDKRILDPDAGPSVRRNLNNWMSEISPGFNIQSYSVDSAGISHAQFQAYGSSQTKPINMGFGLSYAMSIVIALLITKPGGLVVIENPEAHLHPRGQSYLGRLIAKAALAGVQVIIETHSDHLLNGIRVISRLDNDYKLGDFKVFYVSGDFNKVSSVNEIKIGENGELSSWPQGFFDQQANDMKTLIKGKEIG